MNRTERVDWKREFIAGRRVARLATVDETGRPHVVPVVYAWDGERMYLPLDDKPKRVDVLRLRRVRNILANPEVALVVDDYHEDWARLAWVQVRGQARLLSEGDEHRAGVRLLHAKYPQYAAMPLWERPIIVVSPRRIVGWRAQR